MRLCALLVSALLAALLVAGCGSKKSSNQQASAASWADGFCKTFVTWRDDVKSAATKVTSGKASKAALQDAASGIADANNKLADDLEGLGKPSAPNADQAKEAVDELAKTLRDSSAEIKDAAKGVSSRQDVSAAASKIGTTLTSMAGDLTASTGKLQDLGSQDTWKKAFSDSEACQKLANG
jgi:methyl-accepting chemotaxis protein